MIIISKRCICILLVLCAVSGCADSKNAELTSQLNELAIPARASWIFAALNHDATRRIVTVNFDPHWNSFDVAERWLEKGRLRYEEYEWDLESGDINSYITTNSCETNSPEAIVLFDRLQEWPKTHSFEYSPPGELAPVTYVLTLGKVTRTFAANVLGLAAFQSLLEDERECAMCDDDRLKQCADDTCDTFYCDLRLRAFEDPSIFYLQALSFLDLAIQCDDSSQTGQQ